MIKFTCVFYDIQGYEIGEVTVLSCDTDSAMEKVEAMIDERLPCVPVGVDSFLLK
jgi:hypothetical protein